MYRSDVVLEYEKPTPAGESRNNMFATVNSKKKKTLPSHNKESNFGYMEKNPFQRSINAETQSVLQSP